MARIPETEIERLKEGVLVERLVAAPGVEMKKAGKDLLGRCPMRLPPKFVTSRPTERCFLADCLDKSMT